MSTVLLCSSLAAVLVVCSLSFQQQLLLQAADEILMWAVQHSDGMLEGVSSSPLTAGTSELDATCHGRGVGKELL